MSGSVIVTFPPLIAGLLEGMNRRNCSQFQADKWSPYKLMSLTTGVHFLRILAEHENPQKLTTKQLILPAFIGPPIIAGMMYCMGLQIAKIPAKDLF